MIIQKLPKLSAPAGYRPQAIDISVEADLLDFHLLRQRSVTERVEIAANLINGARQFSLQCLEQQFSHLKPQQFARKIAEAWLQDDCPPNYIPQGNRMTWIQNSAELATQLQTLFENANIPYYITGGVAAIAYGDPRTTRDLDVVIQVPRASIAQLVAALEQNGFYVAGADDVAAGRMKTLQVTHMETISRADLMIADEDTYTQQQFERRRRYAFPNATEVYLASPEDVIISKLRWGLRSESEKQRRDVLAILKVLQGELDYLYIYRWAAEFDLLAIVQALTVSAGIREVADRQWADDIYPVALQAFVSAQSIGRAVVSKEGMTVARGNFYNLILHNQTQVFTIESKGDGRLVAQFDSDKIVLHSQPSLEDRQRWNEIAKRIRDIEEAAQAPDQQIEP
ncbi:MAG: hypothetical protein DCF25_02490 [Leptolyngbya foveolarum]|uniref:Nucleotidyltransferase n=1 Tax=Leptolyngbya foveolarum TaxID=47253 RepID=A0A2W4UQD1_9CYAN|nr:MAG: hypothetical protein DCF25_02490 [Leptolyngbya foveolarum]